MGATSARANRASTGAVHGRARARRSGPLAAALALLALGWPAFASAPLYAQVRLESRVESGERWLYDVRSELNLRAASARLVRGGEQSELPPLDVSQEERAEVRVEEWVETARAGRAIAAEQRFLRARASGHLVQLGQRQEFERRSRLEGRRVQFRTDGEPDRRRRDPDEGADPELVAGLEGPFDLSPWLASRPVAEGDGWEVDLREGRRLLQPFGHLRTLEEAGGGVWQRLQREAGANWSGQLQLVFAGWTGEGQNRRAIVRGRGTGYASAEEPRTSDAPHHSVALLYQLTTEWELDPAARTWTRMEHQVEIQLVQRQEALDQTAREMEFAGRFRLTAEKTRPKVQ